MIYFNIDSSRYNPTEEESVITKENALKEL